MAIGAWFAPAATSTKRSKGTDTGAVMQNRLLTLREQWILIGVAAAVVLGGVVLIWRGSEVTADHHFQPRSVGSPTPARATTPAPPPHSDSMAEAPPARLAVGILGAVEQEGLYYFEDGQRIRDLLEAAGGARPEADLSDINRTAHLIDGTTLLVPEVVEEDGVAYSYPATTYNPTPYTRSAWYRLETPVTANSAPSSVARASHARVTPGNGAGPININTASRSELETLPGIGPATAQKIIVFRQTQPFYAPEDLEKVPGIGPAKMAAVRRLVTVQ